VDLNRGGFTRGGGGARERREGEGMARVWIQGGAMRSCLLCVFSDKRGALDDVV
jgi:hypothetical protein